MNKLIAGGCSFTFGNELSDDDVGEVHSKKTWAYGLKQYNDNIEYVCAAHPGTGNTGIARRVFNQIHAHKDNIKGVVVMWTFLSRYDWAMPRHKFLEGTRWATISPWDTSMADEERHNALSGSEVELDIWKKRNDASIETGVKPFAEAIYKYAANQYHEIYLSWKSIIWLQNILEKKKIPFMFTLADNSLFYNEFIRHDNKDAFIKALYKEIDFSKWHFFGERMMGFNQWATMNDYAYATTHPLDEAHQDAVKLMLPTYNKLIGDK